MRHLHKWFRRRRDGALAKAESAASASKEPKCTDGGPPRGGSDAGGPRFSRPPVSSQPASCNTTTQQPGPFRPAGPFSVAAGAGVLPGPGPGRAACQNPAVGPVAVALGPGPETYLCDREEPATRRLRTDNSCSGQQVCAVSSASSPPQPPHHLLRTPLKVNGPTSVSGCGSSSYGSRHDSSRSFPAGECGRQPGAEVKVAGGEVLCDSSRRSWSSDRRSGSGRATTSGGSSSSAGGVGPGQEPHVCSRMLFDGRDMTVADPRVISAGAPTAGTVTGLGPNSWAVDAPRVTVAAAGGIAGIAADEAGVVAPETPAAMPAPLRIAVAAAAPSPPPPLLLRSAHAVVRMAAPAAGSYSTRALFESYHQQEVEQRLRQAVFGSFQQSTAMARPLPPVLASYSSSGGPSAAAAAAPPPLQSMDGSVSVGGTGVPHLELTQIRAPSAVGRGGAVDIASSGSGGDGPVRPACQGTASPHWGLPFGLQSRGQPYGISVIGGVAALSARDLLLGQTAAGRSYCYDHYRNALLTHASGGCAVPRALAPAMSVPPPQPLAEHSSSPPVPDAAKLTLQRTVPPSTTPAAALSEPKSAAAANGVQRLTRAADAGGASCVCGCGCGCGGCGGETGCSGCSSPPGLRGAAARGDCGITVPQGPPADDAVRGPPAAEAHPVDSVPAAEPPPSGREPASADAAPVLDATSSLPAQPPAAGKDLTAVAAVGGGGAAAITVDATAVAATVEPAARSAIAAATVAAARLRRSAVGRDADSDPASVGGGSSGCSSSRGGSSGGGSSSSSGGSTAAANASKRQNRNAGADRNDASEEHRTLAAVLAYLARGDPSQAHAAPDGQPAALTASSSSPDRQPSPPPPQQQQQRRSQSPLARCFRPPASQQPTLSCPFPHREQPSAAAAMAVAAALPPPLSARQHGGASAAGPQFTAAAAALSGGAFGPVTGLGCFGAGRRENGDALVAPISAFATAAALCPVPSASMDVGAMSGGVAAGVLAALARVHSGSSQDGRERGGGPPVAPPPQAKDPGPEAAGVFGERAWEDGGAAVGARGRAEAVLGRGAVGSCTPPATATFATPRGWPASGAAGLEGPLAKVVAERLMTKNPLFRRLEEEDGEAYEWPDSGTEDEG